MRAHARRALPVDRRIYAVVGLRAPGARAAHVVLRCRGERLRLRGLRWTGWNADTVTGRGGWRPATVTLSSPRECATLDGFIYTRARIVTPERTYARVPIACPSPERVIVVPPLGGCSPSARGATIRHDEEQVTAPSLGHLGFAAA